MTKILAGCEADPILRINFGSAPAIVDQIAAEPDQESKSLISFTLRSRASQVTRLLLAYQNPSSLLTAPNKAWPYNVELVYELPNRQFMRKEQSDFGWDWGPAFAPAGPWKPAYCVQIPQSQVYVRNTLIDIYRQDQLNNIPPDQTKPWIVNASIDILGSTPLNAAMTYDLSEGSGKVIRSGELEHVNLTHGAISGTAMIPDGSVDLWWPNGLGPQNLYNMTITLQDGEDLLAKVQKRVGFRTIVLNAQEVEQDQISRGVAPGNNWHFEINGHPFFAKGSNFIPPDAFWPRFTEDKMRTLLESVIDSRQNMLRVWSSGAYSPDYMYDLADEMGILLWSEFEFSDDLYPVGEEFLENVAEEVTYQVRRVNYHPSLAFWAGGNELENLELANVNKSSPDQYERYKAEYEKLFLNTLVPAVFENSRSISYSPSSTSNGYIRLNHSTPPFFTERYNNLEEGSIYGETDYYNYDNTVAFDEADYPVGRFSNEFGFHSMPSLQTWRPVIPEGELHFNSSTVQLRNHHYPPGSPNTTNFYNTSLGMGEMTRAVQTWYPEPSIQSDSIANFSAWCHATQIFQAAYYVNQIHFYRRGSGLPQRTLGSLYWQLEDIWQAPSWASVEYGGRWKVLHYRAKDVYSNVIVSPFFNSSTGNFSVWVTSDLWDDVSGTVDATWYDWSGRQLADVKGLEDKAFTVGALNSTKVLQDNTTTLLQGHDQKDVVLRMNVTARGRSPNNADTQIFSHTNWLPLAKLSDANLVDPELMLHHDSEGEVFEVEATKGVASWVWLDHASGAVVTFDDNGFWLAKGQKRRLGYKVKRDDTGGKWVEGVKAQSLWDQKIGSAAGIVTE